ncbi:MAG: flavodoxin-dependent (E)-4-hydroxy-3-methylbut-2-enyl-diphosphate synthase [Candidatus Omnitrophota bacterium]
MKRIVKIGTVAVGGSNPVRIQGMLKSSAGNKKELLKEAALLKKEGAEILRVAVKEEKDIHLGRLLRENYRIPVVADVHFNSKLALRAIDSGFDCVRINPLNITRKYDIKEIARAALKTGIPLRIGVNSGGFKKKFKSSQHLARQMVESCEECIKILERGKFSDIMVSLKGSDVSTTIIANRLFSKKHDYPIHLGVTATGTYFDGLIKSSIGIGSLLFDGVGDYIRVSLSAPSYLEIRAAKHILQSLGLRKFGPEIISCPTCSRCEVDLIGLVDNFKKKLDKERINTPMSIALMGCVVNGPGEAYQADIGAAFGKKKAVIFKKDKILKRSDENNIIDDLFAEINKMKRPS